MAMRISLNHDVRCDSGFLYEWLGFPNRREVLRFSGFGLGLGFPNRDLRFRNMVKVSFTSFHRRRQLYLQKVQ